MCGERVPRPPKPTAYIFYDISICRLFQYKSFFRICCCQAPLYGLYGDYLSLGIINVALVFNEGMVTYAERKIRINFCRRYPDYQHLFRLFLSQGESQNKMQVMSFIGWNQKCDTWRRDKDFHNMEVWVFPLWVGYVRRAFLICCWASSSSAISADLSPYPSASRSSLYVIIREEPLGSCHSGKLCV